MSSLRSSSAASREQGDALRTLRKGWPTTIALPALIALLGAAALSPLVEMFLGPWFGLSGGRDAPLPWALAGIGLLAFWTAEAVGRLRVSQAISTLVLIAAGLVVIGTWWALEPAYDLGPVLRDPVSLVNDNAHFIPLLMLGVGTWYQGLRYNFDRSLFMPEEIRGNVQRSWALLAVGIVLAALIDGEMGDAGIRAASLAVPVAMATSAGAVAASETASTRFLASRRGATAPGWDRWVRLFGGIVVASLLVTGIAALVLGPGVLAAIVDGLSAAFAALGTVLYWIMFAVVYLLYGIYRAVAWIVNAIFGDIFPEVQPPEMEGQFAQQQPMEEMPLPEESENPYATLLRWIALGIALLIAAFIIYRLTRAPRAGEGEGDPDEERQSIFSASLARKQLRDLFRRAPKPARPRHLDLDAEPASVRETMLYLQVLAARQDAPRAAAETVADFTSRLAGEWQGLAAPLEVLRERYERARYGETEEDRQDAVAAWRQVWSARKGFQAGPA
jgi:hypothetical protein